MGHLEQWSSDTRVLACDKARRLQEQPEPQHESPRFFQVWWRGWDSGCSVTARDRHTRSFLRLDTCVAFPNRAKSLAFVLGNPSFKPSKRPMRCLNRCRVHSSCPASIRFLTVSSLGIPEPRQAHLMSSNKFRTSRSGIMSVSVADRSRFSHTLHNPLMFAPKTSFSRESPT